MKLEQASARMGLTAKTGLRDRLQVCRLEVIDRNYLTTELGPSGAIVSVDVLIEYKDAARPPLSHPFSSAHVLRECWRPLCKRLGLPILQRAEELWISDVAEAKQLVAELHAVKSHLLNTSQADVSVDDAAYMLGRLDAVTPMIEVAIDEWDQIKELSI